MRAALLNKLVLFAALTPGVLPAAEVWDAKPFQDWTQKDVQKIFSNSPWARPAKAMVGSVSAPPAASESDHGPQSQTEVPVIVRWQSALPLRQAQMLGKYGDNVVVSPEAQKFLTAEPAIYVVAISGLAGSTVSEGRGDLAKQSIAEKSTLTVKGKPPVRPIAVDFLPVGPTVDVLIGFPRDLHIALEDQEVELVSEIGRATVRYKFKLKDMLVRGKLEL